LRAIKGFNGIVYWFTGSCVLAGKLMANKRSTCPYIQQHMYCHAINFA
jgi:hypothetical protein